MKKLLLILMLLEEATFGFAQTVETFASPGTFSWLCPAGVTSVKVECWGAGGGGGGVANAVPRVGGGGGGGSYVLNNSVAVTPGVTYTFIVGAGGSAGGTSQIANFGGPGGFSRFIGDAVTVTASGGTGGSGGTTASPQGKGGVLGGLYGFNNITGGSGTYTTGTTTVSITGGGGTGAVAVISTASSLVANVVPTNMGSGFTSVPSVVITSSGTGTGATATALINPDINSGGTITLGQNGSNATASNSGAGGAGAMGGAGGASVPMPASGSFSDGIAGIAPGGGGSGSITNVASNRAGSMGAAGQVQLTYITTLPVLLTSFSAKKQASGILLKWNTLSEQNNSHFDVQRSKDGIDFYNISKVKGAGNSSSSLDYAFIDKNPLFGTSYYRLSQVDFNGNINNSHIEVINLGSEATFSIYPNPTSAIINISGLSDGDVVKIFDFTGKVLKEERSKTNNLSLNMEKANTGIYSISILRNGKIMSSTKLIKN